MILNGTIIKGIGGFYYVAVKKDIYECKARGKFRIDDIMPVVGDRVAIEVLPDEDHIGSIVKIYPRENLLIRPTVSNVDQAIIVFSIQQPGPNFYLLDRFLLLVEEQNLPVYICFNKIDLQDENMYIELRQHYEEIGYKVILTSTLMEEGLATLEQVMVGKTTVLAGPSGVGKSSLINQLEPKLNLKTGEISAKLRRGKHTTRHVELLPLKIGGYVVDTPGFTSLHLDHLQQEDIGYYFKEFRPYLPFCKFNHCSHIHEPSCGVKAALEQNKISVQRYNNYQMIFQEIQQQKRW